MVYDVMDEETTALFFSPPEKMRVGVEQWEQATHSYNTQLKYCTELHSYFSVWSKTIQLWLMHKTDMQNYKGQDVIQDYSWAVKSLRSSRKKKKAHCYQPALEFELITS